MTTKKQPTAIRLTLRHYFEQIWLNRRYSIPGLLLPGIGTIMVRYIPPLIIAKAITDFDGTLPSLQEFSPYLWVFASVWFLGEMVWRLALHLAIRTEIKGMANLYINAIDHLLLKDRSFFQDNFAGSLTKRTIGYARNFESFIDTIMFGVVTNLLPALFATFVLFTISPWLGLALIGTLIPSILIIAPLIKRRSRLVRIRETASNVMAGHVADIISNMDTVQAFAQDEHERSHHRTYVEDYLQKAQKSWDYQNLRIDTIISPLYTFINVLGLALAIAVGGDATTMATVFVTFNYFANVTFVMWEFNRIYRNLENAITDAAQFTELLLQENRITDPKSPINLHIANGEILFKDVDFYYEDATQALFTGLNLRIKPGEKVALVGHSGGGKSTITKLLLRFNDVTNGQLLIDGQDITKARLRDIRSAISYVPQEPIMFHRSITENIRYGKLHATNDEVIHAAKLAHAHEFIAKLPDGYQTVVGERGMKLSGGQRQRIAIARALIKDAPILVLDEATSALDSESEKLIQKSLWNLMEGRTAVVIAHRLSTVQKMDRIIVLENGHIAESGTHQELLAHGGTYAKLWAHQSGGFIEE